MQHAIAAPGLLILLIVVSATAGDAAAAETVRFNRDIRPILSDRCFKCHGPDSAARQADLRLDTQEGLRARRDAVRIVVPGDAAASELVRRIDSLDPDEQMPPPNSGKSLSEAERDLLRRWIVAGAAWEEHWAFVRPQRPARPTVATVGWVRNAVDEFVLAELERRGLAPSPEAGVETLVRRVTLDLTGLPPTPAEVETYRNDPASDRYERLVDRLLASPRFGEHLAVDWLDAARYADTSGYQNDGPRTMWRWRDWVIDALNANMPFDQFTIEQLAGDLLPEATAEQRIATGFNRNHRGNAEGGIIPEEYAVEYVVDRVDTTGAVWLGLTIGCARCHEHKYDPISQEEYYGLFAYFNNVPEFGRAVKERNSPPVMSAPTAEQAEALARLDRELAAARDRWTARQPEVAAAQSRWEQSRPSADEATPWTVTTGLTAHFPLEGDGRNLVDPERGARAAADEPPFADNPPQRHLQLDGSTWLDAGDIANFGYFDPFSVGAWINPAGNLTGGIVSRMSDDVYHDGWSLHLEGGHLQVNLSKRWLDDSLRVETESRVRPGAWQHVLMTYDGSRTASGVTVYLDGVPQPLHVYYDFLNQTITNTEPLRIGSTGTAQRFTGGIADVRIYDRALRPHEAAIVAVRRPVDELSRIPVAKRTAAESLKLDEFFLSHAAADDIRALHQRLRDLEEQRRRLVEAFPTTMVMVELDPPRPTHVLERGAYDRPGARVEPCVPAALSDSGRTGGNRLDLARWIVGPENPLTARVAVNRHWQRLFGVGLVKTAEDFGTQGEPPSHPELLDWLATEFLRTGWDVKALQRLIVTSATYRQASNVSPELLAADPENRWLTRGARFRLPAEMVRDQALAVSGLLTERIGGPSIKPYQPAGLWAEIATDTVYEQSIGPDLYRRSLYVYVKRTISNPTLAAFDATTREACLLRRARTNTPLQALTLLNDVTFVEAGRALAAACLEETSLTEADSSPEDRIAQMFCRAAGRPPQPREAVVLAEAWHTYAEHFRANRAAAEQLLAVGAAPPGSSVDPAELAAYAVIASVILNLDEVVTRE